MTTEEGIAKFITYVDKITADYWKEADFTYAPAPTHTVNYSQKWAKIYKNEGPNGSIYAFVALDDFQNKALGQIHKGDIHMPATHSAPAKHARGNIFDETTYTCARPNGIVYLRGYNG